MMIIRVQVISPGSDLIDGMDFGIDDDDFLTKSADSIALNYFAPVLEAIRQNMAQVPSEVLSKLPDYRGSSGGK